MTRGKLLVERIEREPQAAETNLDDDFPGRCGADDNIVAGIGDPLARAAGQLGAVTEPPQQRVGVEEQVHRRSALAGKQGRFLQRRIEVGLMRMRPRKAPGWRRAGAVLSATRRATGRCTPMS